MLELVPLLPAFGMRDYTERVQARVGVYGRAL